MRRCTCLALLLMIAGCTSLAPVDPDQTLLVTIDMAPQTQRTGASNAIRAYPAHEPWHIPASTRRLAGRLIRSHQLVVEEAWPLEILDELCLVVRDQGNIRAALASDPRVASVQPMQQFVAMGRYNDDRLELQLGSRADALVQLHDWATGAGVRIGMVDSPVDTEHPDLSGQHLSEQLMINLKPRPVDKVHGTAIAGIIGARPNNAIGVAGYAPDAEIFSYAACRFDDQVRKTRCNTFRMALALEAAARDGMDVLNLSLSGPHDPLLERMLRAMSRQGTIIVAAVSIDNDKIDFPAALPFVVAAASSSNPVSGESVVHVNDEHLSTTIGGRYRFFYGASMSAARVSALTALILQRYPGLDTDQARQYLLSSRCPDLPFDNSCINQVSLLPAQRAEMLVQQ